MQQEILTNKEIKVAKHLISGMSAKSIAKHLKLSIRTVEYYQKKIKKKLCCKNTYQTGYKIGIVLNGNVCLDEVTIIASMSQE